MNLNETNETGVGAMSAAAMVTDVWEWYDTKALELHTVVSPHVDRYIEMVIGPPRNPGSHQKMMLTLSFCTIHTIIYFSFVVFYVTIEKLGLFKQYRIQPGKEHPPGLLWKALSKVLINHLLLQYLFVYTVLAGLLEQTGALDHYCSMEMPSSAAVLKTFPLQILLCMIIEDTTFYWSHRFLHQNFIYRHVHKLHHSFYLNHVLAVEYSHPVEAVFSNFIPTWAPLPLLSLHGPAFLGWMVIRIAETCDGHSGYEMPWSPFRFLRNGARHDFHHSHSGGPDRPGKGGIFASHFEFWDWLCGTDKHFVAHRIKLGKMKAL